MSVIFYCRIRQTYNIQLICVIIVFVMLSPTGATEHLYDVLHYYFHNKYKEKGLDTCQSNLIPPSF
jgi:hypothetical protein